MLAIGRTPIMEANRVLKAIRTGALREAFLQNILSHSRLFYRAMTRSFAPAPHPTGSL